MANNYALIEKTLREIRDLLVREPNNETDKKGFNNMGRIERTLREIRDEIDPPKGGEVGDFLRKTETGAEWAIPDVGKSITVVANFSGDPDATKMEIYVVTGKTFYKDSFLRNDGEIQTRKYDDVIEIYTYEPQFSDPIDVVFKQYPKDSEGFEGLYTSDYGVLDLSEAMSYKPLDSETSSMTIGKPVEEVEEVEE